MQYLAMAGFEATEIVSAMPAVLDLAAAAQIDLGRSADIVSNIMTGFGLSAEDTGNAVDVLVKTMTTANTDLPMLGEAMKYVAPVAASLGLSIEETAAAVAKMSDAGIQGSQAGTALRAALLSLANPTGQTVKAMEELGIKITDANGSMKPLPELIGHVGSKLDGMTDAQKTATAAQLVGTEAASGFIALLEVGEDGLRDYVSELENAGGTAERVAKTQMDTLKGSFIEFQSSVEGLGIKIGNDLLPAFTEIVRIGTDLVRGLGEMDGAAVKSGLAFAGTAAGIGLVLSSIGKLSIALRAFTLTPVGAAITALSVLGGMIAAVKMNSDNLNEVTLESADAMSAQRDELAKNIAEFDSLQSKSRLTNDELARFVDLNSQISKTADPAIIAALKDEQEKLREKSGLSNDEMQRLVDLNGKILEVVPESNTTLSEQGNVLLNNTDAAKKYNAEQLELIRLELEAQKAKAESNMQQLLLDETRLLGEQKALKQEIIQINDDETEQRKKIGELESDLAKAIGEGKDSQARKIEFNIALEKKNLEELKSQRAETAQAILDKQKEIDKVQQQIGKLDEVKRKMIDLELKQVGINAKRGDEVKKIDESISKLEAQKKKLQETVPINQRNTGEYAEAVGHIDSQISSLNTVKSRIRDIIGQAGSMNTALGKSITKDVIIRQVGGQSLKRMPGLDYHTGGIVGREPMPKLHTGGLAAQLADAPNHNEIDTRLLRNEMVLTEAQQANLMRMIDAGMTAKSGDTVTFTDPELVSAIKELAKRPAVVNVDGYQVAEATYPYIDIKMAQGFANELRGKGVK
ncbi:MAG: phage tail tape measure protein [Bacillota bacterium]